MDLNTPLDRSPLELHNTSFLSGSEPSKLKLWTVSLANRPTFEDDTPVLCQQIWARLKASS